MKNEKLTPEFLILMKKNQLVPMFDRKKVNGIIVGSSNGNECEFIKFITFRKI